MRGAGRFLGGIERLAGLLERRGPNNRSGVKVVWEWLVGKWNWPGAAAFAGGMLLAISPVVWGVGGELVFWVYLQLPIYMLHQLEEHAGDRFRTFVNESVGGGVEVLSRRATFVINSVGVWGVDLAALYLAVFVGPSWGLMAMYLPLVNVCGHLGQAIALRRYNPGLISALALFVPVAGAGLWIVTRGDGATWAAQGAGLAVALGVHGAIVAHVKSRIKSRESR